MSSQPYFLNLRIDPTFPAESKGLVVWKSSDSRNSAFPRVTPTCFKTELGTYPLNNAKIKTKCLQCSLWLSKGTANLVVTSIVCTPFWCRLLSCIGSDVFLNVSTILPLSNFWTCSWSKTFVEREICRLSRMWNNAKRELSHKPQSKRFVISQRCDPTCIHFTIRLIKIISKKRPEYLRCKIRWMRGWKTTTNFQHTKCIWITLGSFKGVDNITEINVGSRKGRNEIIVKK